MLIHLQFGNVEKEKLNMKQYLQDGNVHILCLRCFHQEPSNI